MMRLQNSFLLSLLLIALNGISTSAQSPNQIAHYNLENEVALQGYDPLAYFTQQKAIKGDQKILATVNGVKYYFASEANKKIFVANPLKYQPEYGGWCAYAMGENGEKVVVNPETFKLLDGKLYLFYNANFVNTLTRWNKNETELKVNADKFWADTLK